jgi:germination protein M
MRYSKAHLARRTWLLLLGAAVAVLLAISVVGCETPGAVGDAGTLAGQPDTPATTATAGTTTVRVYFSRDEKMAAATRVVPKTSQPGAAAISALLEGPTAEEKAAGMVTCVPEGTTFLGLEIKSGVATVNLSQEYSSGGGSLSMFTRLAQVVFTLTQFPTVDGVRFKLDGKLIDTLGGEGIIIDKPVDRADYEDMSPAILVESPTVGATVASPLRITGTALVFEAVFEVNIVDWDGLIIAKETVTASAGTSTRGTFDVTVPFTVGKAGIGSLIVFADSPKDGSPIDVVEIPLQLTK